MLRRIAFVTICATLVAVSASAQRTEGSVSVGYGANDDITSGPPFFYDDVYDVYDAGGLDGGLSYNATLGVYATRGVEFEFLFARQDADVSVDGPGRPVALTRTTVYNYLGAVVYNWGDEDSVLRPFVFGGAGATHYAFGEFLVPEPRQARRFRADDAETRFSSTVGGGLKFYFTRYVGAKVTLRVTPTYITSTPAGGWCDPYYGCWPITEAHYATQFDTSVGVTFRF
jgi:hypothetical protein